MKLGTITLLLGLVFFLGGVNCTLRNVLDPYVYRFGNNYGNVVQVLEGTILPLVHLTIKDISVPVGMSVTYVEVHVYALSPPKVDYSNNAQQVSIEYSLTQLAMSRYKIIVKAVPTAPIDSEEVITIN